MAEKLLDAAVKIAVDKTGLKEGFESAKQDTNSWAAGTGNMVKGALTGVVVGAGALAVAAVAAIGTAAWDVSTQTEQATANIAAALNLPTDKAREFAEVARQVYGNNFADSVTEAGDAVVLLAQQLGLTADDPALGKMTENAFRLRDVFGVDVTDSVDAVRTLMDNFGISADEAFNMLAAGYQKGLDRSGDFLDTVGEYSTQFANGGATVEEFFSLLDSGLQGGVLGTDKAADAFKEFRVRIGDGSKTTAEALASIGINVDDVTARMSDGTLTAADAFTMVQGALAATNDPVVRMQAGVGLLGTQYEDLGDSVAGSLTLTNDWASGSQGAIDSLDAKYATFGDAVEGIWRRLTVSVAPFTDKLLELVNDAVPAIMQAFDKFDAAVGPTMEGIGKTIDAVVDFVKQAMGRFSKSVDEDGVDKISYFKEWADKTFPLIQKLIENVLGAIQAFWDEWGDEIMGIVEFVFGTIFTVIDTALKNVMDLVTFVFQVLTGDFEGAGETLMGIAQRTWDMISGIISGAFDGIKNYITSFDWTAVGTAMIEAIKTGMSNAWSGLTGWFQGKLNDLTALLPGSEPKDPGSPLRNLGGRGAALIGNIRKGAQEEMVRLQAEFKGNLGTLAAGVMAGNTAVTNNVSFMGSSYAPGDALSTVQMLNLHYRTA